VVEDLSKLHEGEEKGISGGGGELHWIGFLNGERINKVKIVKDGKVLEKD